MIRSRFQSLASLATVFMASPAFAQSYSLAKGEEVRFKTEGRRSYQTARVESVAGDSLVVLVDEHYQTLSPLELFTLQRKVGTEKHPLAGLLVGATVGLAVGLIADEMEDYPNREPAHLFDISPLIYQDLEESDGAAYALLGAAVGGLVGLAIGSSVETDVWSDVQRPWSVGLSTTPTGAALALSVPLSTH